MIRIFQCPFCSTVIKVTTNMPVKFRCSYCNALLYIPEKREFRWQWIAAIASSAVVLIAIALIITNSINQPRQPVTTSNTAQTNSKTETKPKNGTDHAASIESELELKKKLQDEFGATNIIFKPSPPFLIAYQLGQNTIEPSYIENCAKVLDATYQAIRNEFKDSPYLKIKEIDRVLPLVILNSKQEYDNYIQKKHNTLTSIFHGIYDFVNKHTVIYYSDEYKVIHKRLIHEASHQLIHHYMNEKPKIMWIQEGLGTYFEGFSLKENNDAITLERAINKSYLQFIKQSESIPLTHILDLTWDGFFKWYYTTNDTKNRDNQAVLYYSQSWALFYYLMTKNRALLEEYMVLEPKETDYKTLFEKLLHKHLKFDISQLQEDLNKFISSLNSD